MSAWRTALDRLRGELQRKPRLRLGVWVVVALVLGLGLTVQSDRLAEASQAHADETRLLAGAQFALQRRDWPDLLAAERIVNSELVARLWRAETEGLAQAQLQQALRDVSERLSLRSTRIQAGLTRSVPGLPGVCEVQARFRSIYSPGDELRLLYTFASFERKLIADRLELASRNSTINVIVSAYFVGLPADACTNDDEIA